MKKKVVNIDGWLGVGSIAIWFVGLWTTIVWITKKLVWLVG